MTMPVYAFNYLVYGAVLVLLGALIGIPIALYERRSRHRSEQTKRASQPHGEKSDPATLS